MRHGFATCQAEPTTSKALTGLAVLALLFALLAGPPPVAGASGSVSVTIRVEVDPADLHGGAFLAAATDGSGRLVSMVAPVLRRSLAGRYRPAEVDRIVDSMTGDCVVVSDGEVVARTPSDAAAVQREGASVFVL